METSQIETAGSQPSDGDFGELWRRLRDDVSMMGRVLERRRNELQEELRELVTQRPLTALGIGFGVGFVLGRGVLRMSIPLAGAAIRIAASDLIASVFPQGDQAQEHHS